MANMDITYIRRRISELSKEKEMMEGFLQEAMTKSILETANENPDKLKMIGNHMMVISSRKLLGNPWSPKFYDWEDSVKSIMNYLSGTPVINWKKKLMELLETNGDVVELKKRGIIWPGHTGIVEKIPIDKVLIEKIVDKI